MGLKAEDILETRNQPGIDSVEDLLPKHWRNHCYFIIAKDQGKGHFQIPRCVHTMVKNIFPDI
jgi:hypothetical protein